MLIAFEGIDGCGKSTQLAMLEASLNRQGIRTLSTRQPTSAYRDAPEVRAYLEEGDRSVGMEQLSRLAADDRKQHMVSVILPSLQRGEWVLCDRYVYSSYAFFRARGVDLALVKHLNAGVRMPDLTVFLDIDASEARQRVVAREGRISKYEERDLEFMAVVRQTFLDCRDESFLILDAGKPAVEIAADIEKVVGRLAGVETQ